MKKSKYLRSLSVNYKGLENDYPLGHHIDYDYMDDREMDFMRGKQAEYIKTKWLDSYFREIFPYNTITEIKYNSDFWEMDELFWKRVVHCKILKSLEWNFSDEIETIIEANVENPSRPVSFKVAGTHLSECRLEKVDIYCALPFKREKEFREIIKNASFKNIDWETAWEYNKVTFICGGQTFSVLKKTFKDKSAWFLISTCRLCETTPKSVFTVIN